MAVVPIRPGEDFWIDTRLVVFETPSAQARELYHPPIAISLGPGPSPELYSDPKVYHWSNSRVHFHRTPNLQS